MIRKPRCQLCKREISGKIDRNCKASFEEYDTVTGIDCKGESFTFEVRQVIEWSRGDLAVALASRELVRQENAQLRDALRAALDALDHFAGTSIVDTKHIKPSTQTYDESDLRAELRKLLP